MTKEVNLFEEAAKNGYRYPSKKGMISTEDLFALPLTSLSNLCLDSIAIELDRQLEHGAVKSFVSDTTLENTVLKNKLAIVVHIIEQKKAANAARLQAKAIKDKRARLLEIIATKQDEATLNKSIDELMAEYEELGKQVA